VSFFLARQMGARAGFELTHRPRSGAGNRLVGRDDDPTQTEQIAHRPQRHHHLDRRTVRVRDQSAMGTSGVRIDLRDHERDVGLHSKRAAVVDDERAGAHRIGREGTAPVGASGEERDVDALGSYSARRRARGPAPREP
jgi:hypothetical protein